MLFRDAVSATGTLCTLASLWCLLHIGCSFKIACVQRCWALFDQRTTPTHILFEIYGWGCSWKILFSNVKQSWNANFLPRLKPCGSSTFSVKKMLEGRLGFGSRRGRSRPISFHSRPRCLCLHATLFGLACSGQNFLMMKNISVRFGGFCQVVPFFAMIGIMQCYCTDVLLCFACFASFATFTMRCDASFSDICSTMWFHGELWPYGELQRFMAVRLATC